MHRLLLVSLGGLLLAMQPQQTETAKQQTAPAKPPQATPAKQQDDPSLVIRTQVTDVELAVTVTDEKGKFVSNLTKNDFRVLDEGKPQKIAFFSHTEKQPIVAGFLVDQSNTMKIHWQKYQDSIMEMIWALMPGDPQYQGYLISYGNEAELAVNTTEDPEKLVASVRRMKPGGGAALFDAIYRACTDRKLVKGEPYEPRRIIIIVGDGHNSAGKRSMEEVLELAKRNMVTIYAISTMSFGFDNVDQDVLEKLARETGGKVEYPLNSLYKNVSGYLSNPSDDGNYALTVGTGGYAAEISAGIIKAVGGIAGEITTQYILRYSPDIDPEGKPKAFRKIKVDIPESPSQFIVRTRDGYYPNGVPGAAPPPGN
jgi:Ca-activated chloride channel family protein